MTEADRTPAPNDAEYAEPLSLAGADFVEVMESDSILPSVTPGAVAVADGRAPALDLDDGEPAPFDPDVAVARLRAEAAFPANEARRGRLLYELGETLESFEKPSDAVAAYEEALTEDPDFLEAAEALVRLAHAARQGSRAQAAATRLADGAKDERSRLRAALLLAEIDASATEPERALETLADALLLDVSATERLPVAVVAEAFAASSSGETADHLRDAAATLRVSTSEDSEFRALLALAWARRSPSLASLRALLEASMERDGTPRPGPLAYAAAGAAEQLAANLADEADAPALLGRASVARAEMIYRAFTDSDAPDYGVPGHDRSASHLVEAALRAAHRTTDADTARALVVRAAGHAGADGTAATLAARATLAIAEKFGDRDLRHDAILELTANHRGSAAAAAFALRLESADRASERAEILAEAAEKHAASPFVVLRALRGAGAAASPREAAGMLDAVALGATSPLALPFALASVYAHARAGSPGLDAAIERLRTTVPEGGDTLLARVERSIAAIAGNSARYTEATARLAAALPLEDRVPLLIEALATETSAEARTRILATLAGTESGRTFAGLFGPLADRENGSLDNLVATAEVLGLGAPLRVFALVRAQASGGDLGATESHLEALRASGEATELVGTFAAASARRQGLRLRSAELLLELADGTASGPLASQLSLEAALLAATAGEDGASLALRAATLAAERADGADAGPARRFAQFLAAIEARTVPAVRAALAADPTPDPLRTFAMEALAGDEAAALAALDTDAALDEPGLSTAIALARLAYPVDGTEPAEAALEALRGAGPVGEALAARVALSRAIAGGDASARLDAARRLAALAPEDASAALEAAAAALATDTRAENIDEEFASALTHFAEALGESGGSLAAAAMVLAAQWATETSGFSVEFPASAAGRLAALASVPPGTDPARRAAVASEVGDALDQASELDACLVAGWNALAAGDAELAKALFEFVAEQVPEPLPVWEGLRAAGEALEDATTVAVACEQLGARCFDDRRAAAFWEQAARAWLSLAETDETRIDHALRQSLARDAARRSAFEALFRRVRDRKDADGVLALAESRLSVTDDTAEEAKLHWERARAFREKGDSPAALKALEAVRAREPRHIGALALAGEIAIRSGAFAEAAATLATLATIEGAPAKNRITAGVTAVDLYENRLESADKALNVLRQLRDDGLAPLPVRERLARAAARLGAWEDAVTALEELMRERPEVAGRAEAARLAMAIYRDKLEAPERAKSSISMLLRLRPGDPEATNLVATGPFDAAFRAEALAGSEGALLESARANPADPLPPKLLATCFRAQGMATRAHFAENVVAALTGTAEETFADPPRAPLSAAGWGALVAPGDSGALSSLYAYLGPTLGEAFGPDLAALGVSKREKIDAKVGLVLRTELGAYAALFGIPDFDLYVGGPDGLGVAVAPGERISLVVGTQVRSPFVPGVRARLGREFAAAARGMTTLLRLPTETNLAVVAAACNIAKVPGFSFQHPVVGEVERALNKAISSKTKKGLAPFCLAVVSEAADARAWMDAARATLDRATAFTASDVPAALTVLGLDPVPTDPESRTAKLYEFALAGPLPQVTDECFPASEASR